MHRQPVRAILTPTRYRASLRFLLLGLGLLLLIGLSLLPAAARPAGQAASAPVAEQKPGGPDCSLLDRPEVLNTMLGLERQLAVLCGRLGDSVPRLDDRLSPPSVLRPPSPEGVDVEVNNHLLDPVARHQDESDLAIGGPAGNIICSAYNDSSNAPSTYMGFSVSTDGGATFTDRGSFASSFGDPSVIYRRADGFFYASSLGSSGLRLYKSTDLCQTFAFQNNIHTGAGDDKEMMRVDNNPASAFYGRMYVCWTNFGASGAPIQATWSSNGGVNWSTPVTVSAPGDVNEQGCWPTVAPNGDVYIVYINGYTNGTNDIKVARSTNGGVSWTLVTNVATGISELGSGTPACGRPGMNGQIRAWAMPQIAVAPDGRVHVAYGRRDGSDQGNIYYQYSTNNGASWSAPMRVNDDTTTNNQWFSAIAVNDSGIVAVSWYDRREDSGNMLFRRYARISYDNGNTWEPNVAVGDASTGVPPLNPQFDPNIADCYMGDYDALAMDSAYAYIQWSDNRYQQNNPSPPPAVIPQPDMFMDRIALQTDFTLSVDPGSRNVCAPASTTYTVTVGSVLGFNAPVTLSALNVPSGTTANFTPNPVVPPGTSSMGVNVGATAAGVYSIGVNGQTVTRTHTTTVTLGVYTATPAVPTLTSPPNGATNVQLRPTFQWQAVPQAQMYHLQVDDDPNFGSPAIDVDVAGTSYQPSANLLSNTTYYWRVRAINPCGQSNYSATWSFTTLMGTGNCPAPGYYQCADLVNRAWITATTPSGITGDDQVLPIPIGFTFNFYGGSYTTVNVSSNGNLQFTTSSTAFSNVCPLPSSTLGRAIHPFWDDLYPPAGGGIYYITTGSAPNRIFTIEYRDIQHFPGSPSGIWFEVQLEEATGDIYFLYRDTDFGDPSINNGVSASVGLQDTNTALEYSCNQDRLFNGLNIRWYRGATPTPTPTGPTPTPTRTNTPGPTNTPTPTPTTGPTATPTPTVGGRCGSIPPSPYGYRCNDTVTRPYIDATTNTGLTGDDETITIPIGFNFSLYGNTYSNVTVSSNGNLQFTTDNAEYFNTCPLPDPTMGIMIAPFWDDLYLPAGGAVEYSVTGTAPNRILTIEWDDIRHFPGSPSGVTFEAQLEEATGRIAFLYQDVDFGDPSLNNGASASVGVQRDAPADVLQYSCNEAALAAGRTIVIWAPPPTSVDLGQFQGGAANTPDLPQVLLWLTPVALVLLVAWAIIRERLRSRA